MPSWSGGSEVVDELPTCRRSRPVAPVAPGRSRPAPADWRFLDPRRAPLALLAHRDSISVCHRTTHAGADTVQRSVVPCGQICGRAGYRVRNRLVTCGGLAGASFVGNTTSHREGGEVASIVVQDPGRPPEKGLKTGALGLISSVVIGVASTAPAYSLAATLGFVVVAIGLQAPIVTILAFVPMYFISIGYQEMNRADPDCGTTFTWATRAFTPRVGWMGGWGIIAADILVMASLAQVAGQYIFELFNAKAIGNNATSGWVLLVGVLWIVAMTWICYVGIEISANFQKALLAIELTMLTIMSVWALIRVGNGSAPIGHIVPTGSWFNPFAVKHFSDFVIGLADMLFIYWGWDTAVACNEETANAETVPGKAAVISTFVLLGTYALVILAVESFAGIGSTGIGLGNSANVGDVLSVLGPAIFGHSTLASILDHLLLLMVLSSAAASTQTTILPTARTTLSMAVYRSIPRSFERIHKRHLTPTVSTVVMGAVSVALYTVMNYLSSGQVIKDSVDSLGVMIAFYYGLTGFTCTWYYRQEPHKQRPQLLHAGRAPDHRRPYFVLHSRMVLLVLLAACQQLHALGHLRSPGRRRLHPRRRDAGAGNHPDVLDAGFPARVLPGRDAQPRLRHARQRGFPQQAHGTGTGRLICRTLAWQPDSWLPMPGRSLRSDGVRCGSVILADHEHRAVRMMDALIRHRADHQPDESAQPPRADHQQAGSSAGSDQHLRRVTRDAQPFDFKTLG